MTKWFTCPFISKLKSVRNHSTFPSNLDETASYLGTIDVPCHGNKICYYASLLVEKITEAQNRQPDPVRINVARDGFIATDKDDRIKFKCHFDELAYVWVHPNDTRLLGVICTFKAIDATNSISKFSAFRMSSKAKKFAHLLQHIYCDYMEENHRNMLFFATTMGDVRIPEFIDEDLDVDVPIRRNSSHELLDIFRVMLRFPGAVRLGRHE